MKDRSIIGRKLLCSKEGFKEEIFKTKEKKEKKKGVMGRQE